MNDHEILKELLSDIKKMSVDELKSSLEPHINGPIFNIMSFNPYEALFSAYAEARYKFIGAAISCLQKTEFMKQVEQLDADRSVAKLVASAANDENFDFMLAA
ncbi:hypothetical protein Q5V23_003178 [Vibrio fluvialis]|nr:hypothetical protein [Vibrio fluvialis]